MQTLSHIQAFPAVEALPKVRQYMAEVKADGEVITLTNLLTLAGAGELALATELAGIFGQPLVVWPADQPRPSRVQTRDYWVVLERPAIDPEVGPVMETSTLEVTIPTGFLAGQGGGEIARLHHLMANTMPGWDVLAISPADAEAEEF